MTNNISNSEIISSLFWKLMERGGTQGINLIVQVVLARILTPADFGTIAIILVFINFAQIFVQSGLNTSLIQKQDADEIDFSSALYASLAVATALYLLIFVAAPVISSFYDNQDLARLLRLLALSLFPGAFNSIQNAYVSRNMLFRKQFFSSLGSIIISGTGGIAAAFAGLDVWALVFQNLLFQISVTIIMWFTVRWRPILIFSFPRIKSLFSFGWKLLVAALLNTFNLELRTLIIGRMYSSSDVGYYSKGNKLPEFLVHSLNGSIQSVMLPTLSSIQEYEEGVKRIVRRSIKTSSFLVFPMMAGLVAAAEPTVRIVLGAQWVPAVPYLQIFCISSALRPIHTANLQAIHALGRSDISLKLEVIANILSLVFLLISIPFGIYTIAFGQIISSFVTALIDAWPNKKLFSYGPKEQIIDILPAAGISTIMGIIVNTISFVNISALPMLLMQMFIGAVIYFSLAKLFKLESAIYINNVVKEKFSTSKKNNEAE